MDHRLLSRSSSIATRREMGGRRPLAPRLPTGQTLRKRGIRAQMPQRVWKTKKNRGRPIKKTVPRCQAERTFTWFQKKYRRLVVRWERLAACFEALLAVATSHIWIQRLIVG